MKKPKKVKREEIIAEAMKIYYKVTSSEERSKRNMKKHIKEYIVLVKDEGWIIVR